MQFIEFHRFDAEPKVCPYRMLEDYIKRVRNTVGENAFKHTNLFVTTTSGTLTHRDTGRRWASDMLQDAGINCSGVHSVHSASSSKSVSYKEPIENVIARCGWKRQSTFFTHYLKPVSTGIKPSSLGPLSTADLQQFYRPQKLLTDKSPAIPDTDYVLSSEVFIDHPDQFSSDQEVVFIPVMTEPELPVNSITDAQSEAQKQNRKFDMLDTAQRDNAVRKAQPVTVTDNFSATGTPSFSSQSHQVIDLTNSTDETTPSTSANEQLQQVVVADLLQSPPGHLVSQPSCIVVAAPAATSALCPQGDTGLQNTASPMTLKTNTGTLVISLYHKLRLLLLVML